MVISALMGIISLIPKVNLIMMIWKMIQRVMTTELHIRLIVELIVVVPIMLNGCFSFLLEVVIMMKEKLVQVV